MCALYVCLICVPYMCALYVCPVCMVLGIIVKTYDAVEAELEMKARTETTGSTLLMLKIKAMARMLVATSVDELRRVSPVDRDSADKSDKTPAHGDESALAGESLGPGLMDVFERDALTQVEFHALFGEDPAALDRLGVRSVAELCDYADQDAKGELDMQEVREFVARVGGATGKAGGRGSSIELELAQLREAMEEHVQLALDAQSHQLKQFIHAQLSSPGAEYDDSPPDRRSNGVLRSRLVGRPGDGIGLRAKAAMVGADRLQEFPLSEFDR